MQTCWMTTRCVALFSAACCAAAFAAEPLDNGPLKRPPDAPQKRPGDEQDSGQTLLLETLRRSLLELTQSVEQLRTELQQTQAALKLAHDDNAALRRELEQKAAAFKAVTENLAVSQTELELFRRENERLRLRLQNLGGQLNGDGGDLEKKFADALRLLEKSERQQEQLRVQLARVIEIAEALAPAPSDAPHAGRLRELVLADLDNARRALADNIGGAPGQINGWLESATVLRENSELQLVVLNVGRASGARLGMPFAIYQDNKVVARARVVDVRDTICGAMIVESVKKPKPGDRAAVEKAAP
jgi:septal ring factor EnvC (AmiA/AmiB activator)